MNPGYYWVRFKNEIDYKIMRFTGFVWYDFGEEDGYITSDLDQADIGPEIEQYIP